MRQGTTGGGGIDGIDQSFAEGMGSLLGCLPEASLGGWAAMSSQPLSTAPACGPVDLGSAAAAFRSAASRGSPEGQSAFAFLAGWGLLGSPAERRGRRLGEPDAAAAALYHRFALQGGSQASRVALADAAFRSTPALSRAALLLEWPPGGEAEAEEEPWSAEEQLSCARAAALYSEAASLAVQASHHQGPGLQVVVEPVRLSRGGRLGGAHFRETSPQARMGHGHGGTQDGRIQHLQLAAELGDARALRRLGDLHFWGVRGMPRDPARALGLYRRAAAAGDMQAMAHAGEMLARGIGTERPDVREGVRHFEAAAAAGHADGLNGLGYVYAGMGGAGTGAGADTHPVTPNFTAAAEYFQRAADKGSRDGSYNAGVLAMLGKGVSKDTAAARGLFSRAAALGHTHAAYQLGRMALLGLGGSRPDACKAARLHKRVAETGQWGALLRSGLEAFMEGTEASRGRALLHYLRAAELGFEIGQSNAAWMLEQGMGVAAVLLPLARMGLGAEEPLEALPDAGAEAAAAEEAQAAAERLALRLWALAARQGNAAAALRLGDAARRAADGEHSGGGEAAFSLYRTAAALGSAQAFFNLAGMVEEGVRGGFSIPPNASMAAELYSDSLEADPSGWLPVLLAQTRLRLRRRLEETDLLAAAEILVRLGSSVAETPTRWLADALGRVSGMLQHAGLANIWTALETGLDWALRILRGEDEALQRG